MTTLILGVGQRFLPVLEHTILRRQGFVAPILILIAAGNLLRVTFELATMWVAATNQMGQTNQMNESNGSNLFVLMIFR